MQVMYRGVQRFRAFVGSAPASASALAKVSVEMLALRVVGVSHYSLNDAIFRERLRQGDPAVVTHEPDNKHDANAMAVYVQGKRIGYIPRELQHVAEPYLDGTHQWVLSKVGAFKPSDNNNNNSDHPHPSAATSSRSSSGHSKHTTTSGETVAMRLIEHGLEEYVDVLREHDAVLGDDGITEDTLIRYGLRFLINIIILKAGQAGRGVRPCVRACVRASGVAKCGRVWPCVDVRVRVRICRSRTLIFTKYIETSNWMLNKIWCVGDAVHILCTLVVRTHVCIYAGFFFYFFVVLTCVLANNGVALPVRNNKRMGIARKIHRRRVLAAVAEPARVQGQKLVPYATLCHAQFWATD